MNAHTIRIQSLMVSVGK